MPLSSRYAQQLFFRFGIRPAALLVVLVCGGLVFSMLRLRRAGFVAPAVTRAPSLALASLRPARVASVHVAVGQHVTAGQRLASLGAPELELERDAIEAEIRRLARAAEVDQLALLRDLNAEQRQALVALVEAERDKQVAHAEAERTTREASAALAFLGDAERLVKAGMLEPGVAAERAQLAASETSQQAEAGLRLSAEQARLAQLQRELDKWGVPGGLLQATAQLHRAELEILERKRAHVASSLAGLSIVAPIDGVVAELLPEGSVAEAGRTVARVVPMRASEVVAFVAPDTALPLPTSAMPFAVVLADGGECTGRGLPRSTGEVARKPEQLVGPGGYGAWGFPISIALDSSCHLPLGQVVELRLGTP